VGVLLHMWRKGKKYVRFCVLTDRDPHCFSKVVNNGGLLWWVGLLNIDIVELWQRKLLQMY
jgi:hypothetical protein